MPDTAADRLRALADHVDLDERSLWSESYLGAAPLIADALEAADELKEAAWDFKMTIYSLDHLGGPRPNEPLTTWLTYASENCRPWTPSLHFAKTHDRLVAAVSKYDAALDALRDALPPVTEGEG